MVSATDAHPLKEGGALPESSRQLVEQVARHEPGLMWRDRSGEAVCGRRGGCGGDRVESLRKERRDDAREDVAGAGRRERRRAGVGDDGVTARRLHDRARALEQHDDAEPLCPLPGRVEPVGVDRRRSRGRAAAPALRHAA